MERFIRVQRLSPRGRAGKSLAVLYISTVTVLAGFAWGGGPLWTEIVAMVLCLPALVVTFPGIYVVGALAWTTADESGRASWQVTVTFMMLFAVTAAINVGLTVWASHRVRPGRAYQRDATAR